MVSLNHSKYCNWETTDQEKKSSNQETPSGNTCKEKVSRINHSYEKQNNSQKVPLMMTGILVHTTQSSKAMDNFFLQTLK